MAQKGEKMSEGNKRRLGFKNSEETWAVRVAPSLGALEDTHQNVWGTVDYEPEKHLNTATCFFGLYGFPDFYALWKHKGPKHILWAGSDILNFRKGYWLDETGNINLGWMGDSAEFPKPLAQFLGEKCENWVENEGEAWQLRDCGISVTGIVPSFLGNIQKYPVSFRPGNKVYLSASQGRQMEYGWGIVHQIACELPEIEFHLYGASCVFQPLKNVIYHGRVPKNKMNTEIRNMQCGLRLNKHDGFSEVTAKSVLWGQYPITYLYHPHIQNYPQQDDCGQPYCTKSLQGLVRLLRDIPKKKKPNLEARTYYRKHLNRYPWTEKRTTP